VYIEPELLRRLDELARIDLKAIRDSYFAWLLISSALVGIGVLMEGPEIAEEFRKLGDKANASIPREQAAGENSDDAPLIGAPNQGTSSWIRWIGLLGWVLCSVGIVGEGVFEGFTSEADGLLQTFNETLLTDARERTANAQANAESARALAKSFEGQIADAQARVKEAGARVAFANARAEEAIAMARGFESQIAQSTAMAKSAEERTAQIELELARIKLPRSLNEDARRRVASTVSRFAGENFAFLVFGDPESLGLLGDIDASLKIAKWKRANTPEGLGGDLGYNTADGNVPSINDIGLKVFAAADDPMGLAIVVDVANAISVEGVPCDHIPQNG
jgi:hypothetical protein